MFNRLFNRKPKQVPVQVFDYCDVAANERDEILDRAAPMPEFTFIDRYVDRPDESEYSDPFFVVAEREEQCGCPLAHLQQFVVGK